MKRLSDQTLYEILEVPPGAARSEIESSYERVKALYGPGSLATYTLMSPDEAALLTSRIEEARRTLLDAEARAQYDASLSAREEHARPATGAAAARVPLGPLPPVIPALQPAARDPAPPAATPVPQPVILLAAATEAAGPVAEAPRPILLMREIVPAPTPPPAEALTPSPEILQPEGSVWTGEALRKVREARGISIPQIAERTKVTRHHVENIEGERYGALPAPVYLRGILFSLARELRLDGQRVARSYLDRAAAASDASGARSR